ncbi:uncharacterized protein LOC142332089 [Lycorma delicatula]|uniref:uncharacterized protein LOC142332089 n=1 Tax=Lycorma delicatula TaxID=130591 RepID=UPI003F512C81
MDNGFYDLYDEDDVGSVLNLLDGNCSDLEGLENGDEIEDEAPSKGPTRIGADVVPRNEELAIQDDAEIQELLLQTAPVLPELPSLQVAPVQSAPILNEKNQAGEQVNQNYVIGHQHQLGQIHHFY